MVMAIDAYLLFAMMTGIGQLIYCMLTFGRGGYPMNAFLGSFCAALGSFVLTGIYRYSLVFI